MGNGARYVSRKQEVEPPHKFFMTFELIVPASNER
jgi:hypothetical protein